MTQLRAFLEQNEANARKLQAAKDLEEQLSLMRAQKEFMSTLGSVDNEAAEPVGDLDNEAAELAELVGALDIEAAAELVGGLSEQRMVNDFIESVLFGVGEQEAAQEVEDELERLIASATASRVAAVQLSLPPEMDNALAQITAAAAPAGGPAAP
jgi:hypothetical protein